MAQCHHASRGNFRLVRGHIFATVEKSRRRKLRDFQFSTELSESKSRSRSTTAIRRNRRAAQKGNTSLEEKVKMPERSTKAPVAGSSQTRLSNTHLCARFHRLRFTLSIPFLPGSISRSFARFNSFESHLFRQNTLKVDKRVCLAHSLT